MTNFQPLTIKDRSLVLSYFRQYPPEISEFTFTNLFAWRKSRPIFWTELDNSLLFLINDTNEKKPTNILFGPPVGNTPLQNMIESLDDQLTGMVRLPSSSISSIKTSGLHPEPDPNNADYVYLVSDLAELEGRNYAKKRNHVKQCLQNYHCEYEPITSANISECKAMQDSWCQSRNCMIEPGLCGEYEAIKETFDHYQDFNLIGGAIRLNGKIKAFAIGEQLNPTTAVCHFEKAMPQFHGLAQLINQWFAKYSLQQFKFINREQDLGIPGLRQSKESYHPHHKVEKFNIATLIPLDPVTPITKGCPPLEC